MKFELHQPDCLDEAQWAELSAQTDRLERALVADDAALAIGTAKELCETCAKLVLLHRHESFSTRDDLPQLVHAAHRIVGRLPASGRAEGSAVIDLAGPTMHLVRVLTELRNRAGTGHGRPDPVPLDQTDAQFAAGIAYLWSNWVLARLDAVVSLDPHRLADDITSIVFRRGELTQRFADTGLALMDDEDLREVGLAVGERGGPRGTFNVRIEGIDAPASSASLEDWPLAYREGAIEGLFFDLNGYLRTDVDDLQRALDVARPLPDRGAAAFDRIVTRACETELAYSVTADAQAEFLAALDDAARVRTGRISELLTEFGKRLAPTHQSSSAHS